MQPGNICILSLEKSGTERPGPNFIFRVLVAGRVFANSLPELYREGGATSIEFNNNISNLHLRAQQPQPAPCISAHLPRHPMTFRSAPIRSLASLLQTEQPSRTLKPSSCSARAIASASHAAASREAILARPKDVAVLPDNNTKICRGGGERGIREKKHVESRRVGGWVGMGE